MTLLGAMPKSIVCYGRRKTKATISTFTRPSLLLYIIFHLNDFLKPFILMFNALNFIQQNLNLDISNLSRSKKFEYIDKIKEEFAYLNNKLQL